MSLRSLAWINEPSHQETDYQFYLEHPRPEWDSSLADFPKPTPWSAESLPGNVGIDITVDTMKQSQLDALSLAHLLPDVLVHPHSVNMKNDIQFQHVPKHI